MLKYDKDNKWVLDRCVSNLHHRHVSQCYRGDFLSTLFPPVDIFPVLTHAAFSEFTGSSVSVRRCYRWISRCWFHTCSSPLSRSRQHIFPLEPQSRGWSVRFGVPRRRGRILIWNTISQFSLSEQQQLQKGCREAAPSTYFDSNLLENFFVFPIWFV